METKKNHGSSLKVGHLRVMTACFEGSSSHRLLKRTLASYDGVARILSLQRPYSTPHEFFVIRVSGHPSRVIMLQHTYRDVYVGT